MIIEGSIPSGSVRFKLNGLTKTINFPVSGAALHLLAGNPTTLVSGDVAVPNTQAPFTLVQHQELISTHTLGGTKPAAAFSPVEHSPVEHSPAPNVLAIDEARVVADTAKLTGDEATLVADTTTFHKL
jgi:hypothetical protein